MVKITEYTNLDSAIMLEALIDVSIKTGETTWATRSMTLLQLISNFQKTGEDAITSGSNTIVFATPLINTDYEVYFNCFDSEGGRMYPDIENKTVNGFDVNNALDNGTIDWCAVYECNV